MAQQGKLLCEQPQIYSTGPKTAISSCPAVRCCLLARQRGAAGEVVAGAGLQRIHRLLHPCTELLRLASLLESPDPPSPSRERCQRMKTATKPLSRGCRIKVKLWFWIEVNRKELCGEGGMRLWPFSFICQVLLNPSAVVLSPK